MTPLLLAELGRDMARVVSFLGRLSKGQYFGEVRLKFEGGRITLIRTEQAIKPDELDGVRLIR